MELFKGKYGCRVADSKKKTNGELRKPGKERNMNSSGDAQRVNKNLNGYSTDVETLKSSKRPQRRNRGDITDNEGDFVKPDRPPFRNKKSHDSGVFAFEKPK